MSKETSCCFCFNIPQNMNFSKCIFATLAILVITEEAAGHGMMLDPPNRSSLWRFDPTAPINYNDNENFCGGFGVQWGVHKGKCGVCGDNYGDPIPRANENTGKYGQGKVVAQYPSGSTINITILLTANHKGWFNYSLCHLKDQLQPERDECFQKLLFHDGSEQIKIEPSVNYFFNSIRLPVGLKCERCVLRWTYKTGNSWGICEDGTGAVGCGPQETFRSCADIAIA